MSSQERDEYSPFLEAPESIPVVSSTIQEERMPLKSLSRSRSSSAGPFAHSNIRMVSRLKSRASLEWDTPTPKSRLPPRPTFLCDLDAHLLPTVDFSHFNNAKSIVRLGKADAGNARLAKSWNGKPGDLSLSFHPEHTSTPSRNGKRALSLSTRANVSNNFLNKSTTLAETSHTVPLISNWAPSTHLFTPASWPLKSAPFKRFPGSRVFDCYAFPPKLDSASVRESSGEAPDIHHPHHLLSNARDSITVDSAKSDRCRRTSTKRETLSRIPRLLSLQHLRPTPAVIASTEALANEVRSTLQGAKVVHHQQHASSHTNSFGRRLSHSSAQLTSRPQSTTSGGSNASHKPTRLLQENPANMARLRDETDARPRTLRSSVSTGCLTSGAWSRRQKPKLSRRARLERPPSSCLSTVGSDAEEF